MSSEYIVNGGFETGDFTGWNPTNMGGAQWVINDGNVPVPPEDELWQPISGDYDALVVQWDWSLSILFQQSITVPSNITSATLSWSDRIVNYHDCFGVNQKFQVVFLDENSNLVSQIFSTEPGDPLMQYGPNDRSFDVTDLAQTLEGQEIYVAFAVLAASYHLPVAVDNISLDIDTAQPVEIDIKPGSEPNCFNNDGHGVIPVAILGSAEFDVTTIDAGSVMLQGLAVKAVGKSNKLLAHYEDVDSDGYDDLVVQIEDDDLVFEEGDTTATVTGNLNNGMPIQGSDTICIVP
jgi:hypothetical protein